MNPASSFIETSASSSSKTRTCVIIDDEERGRAYLCALLRRNFPDLLQVGQAVSVVESVALIARTNPDIAFLDVDIIGGTAFDVLERLDPKPFVIICSTSYNNPGSILPPPGVAILLKPISIDALREVLQSKL